MQSPRRAHLSPTIARAAGFVVLFNMRCRPRLRPAHPAEPSRKFPGKCGEFIRRHCALAPRARNGTGPGPPPLARIWALFDWFKRRAGPQGRVGRLEKKKRKIRASNSKPVGLCRFLRKWRCCQTSANQSRLLANSVNLQRTATIPHVALLGMNSLVSNMLDVAVRCVCGIKLSGRVAHGHFRLLASSQSRLFLFLQSANCSVGINSGAGISGFFVHISIIYLSEITV